MTAIVELALRVLGFVVALSMIVGVAYWLMSRNLRRAKLLYYFCDYVDWREGTRKSPPTPPAAPPPPCQRCGGKLDLEACMGSEEGTDG